MTEKIKVKLTGENGNAFNLVAIVRKALIDNGEIEKAKEFVDVIFKSENYEALLLKITEFVDVE